MAFFSIYVYIHIMNYIYTVFNKIQFFINSWWPWLDFLSDVFFIQLFMVVLLVYITTYNSVYYTLLYTFIIFFLIGVALSIFQIELFTAFLWLIECSVLFVFLLLLFYLNVKNFFKQTQKQFYFYIIAYLYIAYLGCIIVYNSYDIISLYNYLDNVYETLYNQLQNDLFVFSISYYTINVMEFTLVGFLLLVGSMVCVNLYQFNKNVRVQNHSSFLNVFNFFNDFAGFLFLRKQSLIKQGNTKASLKIFKKK